MAEKESDNFTLPDGWGIEGKTGVLKDVLLGDPANYEWLELSAISQRTFRNLEKLGVRFDRSVALAQHAEFAGIYESAGVRVHYLEAYEGLTHSVFARDNSVMTPWGPIITSLQVPTRRREYAVTVRFYQAADIPIWKWVTAGHLEGGDVNTIEPGKVMIGHCEERSEEAAALQAAGWFRQEGWEALTVAIPAHFVHMDALVVMAAPKLAAVCVEALEDYVLDWLRAQRIEMIPVPYYECARLGCNVVPLGNDRVISMATNKTINEQLAARGIQVYAPDMSMYQYGGGGVHCLSQELRRERE
jgi:N-dimethylarginine dimethylaminohydrolase